MVSWGMLDPRIRQPSPSPNTQLGLGEYETTETLETVKSGGDSED